MGRPRRSAVIVLVVLAGFAAAACGHAPVRPWQREHLAKPAMQFDDGLATRFGQHLFSSREGVDGGYGYVGGGCGCN